MEICHRCQTICISPLPPPLFGSWIWWSLWVLSNVRYSMILWFPDLFCLTIYVTQTSNFATWGFPELCWFSLICLFLQMSHQTVKQVRLQQSKWKLGKEVNSTKALGIDKEVSSEGTFSHQLFWLYGVDLYLWQMGGCKEWVKWLANNISTPPKPTISSSGDDTCRQRAQFLNNLCSAAKKQINIGKRYIASQ